MLSSGPFLDKLLNVHSHFLVYLLFQVLWGKYILHTFYSRLLIANPQLQIYSYYDQINKNWVVICRCSSLSCKASTVGRLPSLDSIIAIPLPLAMAAATHLTVQTKNISSLKSSHSDSSLLDTYNHDYPRHRQDSERETTSSEEGAEDELAEPEKTESDQDQEEADKFPADDEDLLTEDEDFRARMDSQKSRTASITEMRAHAFDKLQEELMKAKEALELKDEQVSKLTRVREEMDQEIEELTASLFEEAHAMVREANLARAAAEKKLHEANGKIDMLQAEVQALKLLVITSTPSSPHPVSPKSPDNNKKRPIFKRSKKKDRPVSMYSHQRNHSYQGPLVLDSNNTSTATALASTTAVAIATGDNQGSQSVTPPHNSPVLKREVDPLLLRDFEKWRSSPTLSRDDQFISRVFSEDVQPCLNFTNQILSKSVLESVENNTLCMEPWNEKGAGPRRCALTDQQRPCLFRIKLDEMSQWDHICPAARNRIAAVCDFYTYLRYIQQGLVKSDLQEVYWEMIRLRKEMSSVKLGLQ